ncbi:MAG: hypothetical protein K6T61_17835, partial [Bryobacteraceae bacterium]|nr:hypothetical protein [Bryobacteraceae bacterium]
MVLFNQLEEGVKKFVGNVRQKPLRGLVKGLVSIPKTLAQSGDLALVLVMSSIVTQNVKVRIGAEEKDGKMVAW